MLVKLYQKLRGKIERLKERKERGRVNVARYALELIALRILIQSIVLPHFLLLGPFKTFTSFARKDDRGSWIDSYDDFIVSNKVNIKGVVAIILIGLAAIFIFIYLPIFYI